MIEVLLILSKSMVQRSFFLVAMYLVSIQALAQRNGSSLKLMYNGPATVWEEALPLGNGQTGAMVFGRIGNERLQLNDNTLWSGYPEPGNNPNGPKYLPLVRHAIQAGDYDQAALYWKKMQGPYSARYLPMADLILRFHHRDTTSITNYRRSLDLMTAVVSTSYRSNGVQYKREVFISYPDKALVMRLTANRKKRITFDVGLTSKLRFTARTTADELILNGKAPMYVADRNTEPLQVVYDEWDGEGMTFEMHVKVIQNGGHVERSDTTLSVVSADAVTLILTESTSFNGYNHSPGHDGKDAGEESVSHLAKAMKKTYAQLMENHLDDYQPLFNRVKLDLGVTQDFSKIPTDERMLGLNRGNDDRGLIELYYQYGRYLIISCSRPGSPPANLQGMWNDHVQPPWGSNYTININTEMNYWPVESANLAECHQPLLDFIGNLAHNGAETARINYGIENGWCAHHNSDIWAKSSPPGGYEWDPRSQARWACWPMSGAWLSLHLWEHFQFGGDIQYLRTQAWPLMRGAAQFLLSWLIESPDGYLVTNPSTSPENVFKVDGKEYQLSMATTMDMAITRELFESCIRAADILKIDDPFTSQVREATEKLYPYHIGQYGQLQEWFKDWDDPEDKHRHLSHLFGLHPGSQISPLLTPTLAAAAKQSLIHRGDVSTGWSMAWKINWWARLRDGNHAMKILKDGLTYIGPKKEDPKGGGTYPNLFDAHPPFQIDGNFGGTAGITQMLLQSHAGEISILPALPDEWKHGSVQGLRTRGGFLVDMIWKDRIVQKVSISSTLGGNCRVRTAEPVKVLETTFGPASGDNTNPLTATPRIPPYVDGSRTISRPIEVSKGFLIDFQTEKGKTYTLVPL
jgi:alpha-L-fucosidase 2